MGKNDTVESVQRQGAEIGVRGQPFRKGQPVFEVAYGADAMDFIPSLMDQQRQAVSSCLTIR
jgi:hypothetical protein